MKKVPSPVGHWGHALPVSSKLARAIGARKIGRSCIVICGNVVDCVPECQTIGRALPVGELPEFGSLDLADTEYGSGSKIDLLLGVGYCAPCLLDGMVHSSNRITVAMNTICGWIIGGGCDPHSLEPQTASTCLKISPNRRTLTSLLKSYRHCHIFKILTVGKLMASMWLVFPSALHLQSWGNLEKWLYGGTFPQKGHCSRLDSGKPSTRVFRST